MLNMNVLPAKQKVVWQSKKIIENKLRLGQGRAGISCKKSQLIESKSCEIPKMHMTQNVTKNITDFPV